MRDKNRLTPHTSTLPAKIAQWFMSETPSRNLNIMTFTDTGLPMHHFQKAWTAPYPIDWNSWKVLPAHLQDGRYPGATLDLHFAPKQPFKDIMNWDRRASALGVFPETFGLFVRAVTKSNKNVNKIINAISCTMRTHSYTIFKKYWSLDKTYSPNNQLDGISLSNVMLAEVCERV